MSDLSIEDLGGIVPPSLRKRILLAKVKLWLIVFVWLSVAFYSFFATFWGYKIINLGNTSFILAFASQFFTVIYAIPEIGNIKKRIFNRKTLIFWLILCLSAHLFSFFGSAFYHYVLTTKVKSRPDFTTPSQLDLLTETQRKLLFNTNDYKKYLHSLSRYYKSKMERSEGGAGASLLPGKGKRYAIFKTVAGAIDEEISMAEGLFPDDQITKITDPNMKLDDFVIILGGMSGNILHPNSRTESLAAAVQNFIEYKETRPLFDYGKNETPPEPVLVRKIVRNHMARYPFVKVEIPYELGSGGFQLGAIDRLMSIMRFWESETRVTYSKSFGLIAAAIIEIATFIFNLFLIVQDNNLRMITKKLNRSSVLYNAMERAKSTIVHFSYISEKIEKLDLSYPVMIILLAKEQIFYHTDMGNKIQFSDQFVGPVLSSEKENRGILKTAWNKMRIGHEAIFYCIKPDWTNTINDFSGIDVDQIEFTQLDKPLDKAWKAAVISMVVYLFRYFSITQELMEKDNKYWVDMRDFDDWFTMVQEETGIRGINLPEIVFEGEKMNIKDFYGRLRRLPEKSEKENITTTDNDESNQ